MSGFSFMDPADEQRLLRALGSEKEQCQRCNSDDWTEWMDYRGCSDCRDLAGEDAAAERGFALLAGMRAAARELRDEAIAGLTPDELRTALAVEMEIVKNLRRQRDAMWKDVVVLLDHHTSDELKAEARARLIERESGA